MGRLSTLDKYPKIAIDQIDGIVAIVDQNGFISFINSYTDEYASLFQTKLANGVSIFDAFPESLVATAQRTFQDLMKSGNTFSFDAKCVDKHGASLVFEVKCKPMVDDPENKTLLIHAHDVSSQKIFEKKIQAIASEMKNLIENANAVIILADSRGYITHWNKMATDITGYKRNDVVTMKLEAVLSSPGDEEKLKNLVDQTLRGESMVGKEIIVKAKSDEEKSLLANATPRRNANGDVVGITIMAQDVTELATYRKSLEEKVEERTRQLSESNREIRVQRSIAEEERKKSDSLLRNILPDSVAMELKSKGFVTPRYYRMSTVLFADLVGFTTISKKLSPQQMLDELSYIFTGLDLISEKNGLEKIKTMGDGFMAVGGIPDENTTNPLDATRAGIEMVNFIERVNRDNVKNNRPPWKVRIGIHSGELVAGVIGKNKFAYDVWGSTVNVASRMQAFGSEGKVNISETTYHLVKDHFACGFRGSVPIKNLGEMNMYFAVESFNQEEMKEFKPKTNEVGI